MEKDRKMMPIFLMWLWFYLTTTISVLLIYACLDSHMKFRHVWVIYSMLGLNAVLGATFWWGYERYINKDFYSK